MLVRGEVIDEVVFIGGFVKSKELVKMIEEILGKKIFIVEDI